MSEVTHPEVSNAELTTLVRSLEASQAALVRRIEELEHRAGVARYARLQRSVGDYCPSVTAYARPVVRQTPAELVERYPERPATLDPVVHARLNSSEDF